MCGLVFSQPLSWIVVKPAQGSNVVNWREFLVVTNFMRCRSPVCAGWWSRCWGKARNSWWSSWNPHGWALFPGYEALVEGWRSWSFLQSLHRLCHSTSQRVWDWGSQGRDYFHDWIITWHGWSHWCFSARGLYCHCVNRYCFILQCDSFFSHTQDSQVSLSISLQIMIPRASVT